MATKTYSTGQTVEDLRLIAQLFHAADGNRTVSNLTFPVLLDPYYIAPTRGPYIYSIVGTATLLALVAVILRCISRIKCSPGGRLLSEDWAIIIGLVFTLASSLIMIVGVAEFQFGMHIYDLRYASLDMNLKMAYAGQVIYLWATMFIRLSLLLFIRRLYREISAPMYYTCTALCYANFLHCVAASLAYILQCSPIEAAFSVKLEAENGICQKIALYYTFCATGMIADIILILLPLDLMRRLRVESRKKVQTLGMFGLGVIACAASIIRFAFLFKSLRSIDASWDIIPTSICCALEDTLAIITSCVPAIKMLFTSSVFVPSGVAAKRRRETLRRQDLASAGEGPENEGNELARYRRPSVHHINLRKVMTGSLASDATISFAAAVTLPSSPGDDGDKPADLEEADMYKPSMEFDPEDGADLELQATMDADCSWFDFNVSPPELSYLSEGDGALPAEEPWSRRYLVGGPGPVAGQVSMIG